MTRDMELVRKILLAIAASERPLDSAMVRISHYAPEQIGEHIRLLQEARLVDGTATMGPDRRQRWSELRLTWWGHDFIECARNETIWRKANEALSGSSGSSGYVGLDVWRQTLIESAFLVLGRAPDGSHRLSEEEQPPLP